MSGERSKKFNVIAMHLLLKIYPVWNHLSIMYILGGESICLVAVLCTNPSYSVTRLKCVLGSRVEKYKQKSGEIRSLSSTVSAFDEWSTSFFSYDSCIWCTVHISCAYISRHFLDFFFPFSKINGNFLIFFVPTGFICSPFIRKSLHFSFHYPNNS